MVGNKGALHLTVNIGGAVLEIINIHLQHGDTEFETRAGQLRMVVDSMRKCDYAVVAGDFNFRVNASLEAAHDWVEARRYINLLSFDETGRTELQSKGFREGVIRFPPSYKIQTKVAGLKYD
jgi:hypothetical protein